MKALIWMKAPGSAASLWMDSYYGAQIGSYENAADHMARRPISKNPEGGAPAGSVCGTMFVRGLPISQ
jgi:hypothetical protein